jgi:hypothetical protein
MKVSRVGLVLLVCFGTTQTFAQPAMDEDGKVIHEAFAASKIPMPELGWVLPDGTLVTEVAAKEVTIFAERMGPKVAPRVGLIPAAAAQAFVKKNEVDCDQVDSDKPVPLYRYDAKMPVSKVATQVFVLAGRQGLTVNDGFQEYAASDVESGAVWRAYGL